MQKNKHALLTHHHYQPAENVCILYGELLYLPVVTSFLMPLTESVAPLIPLPSRSFTTPFIPRWTWSDTELGQQ